METRVKLTLKINAMRKILSLATIAWNPIPFLQLFLVSTNPFPINRANQFVIINSIELPNLFSHKLKASRLLLARVTWFISIAAHFSNLHACGTLIVACEFFNLRLPFVLIFSERFTTQSSCRSTHKSFSVQEEINRLQSRCPSSVWCLLLQASWKSAISLTRRSSTTWSSGATTESRARFCLWVASLSPPTIWSVSVHEWNQKLWT